MSAGNPFLEKASVGDPNLSIDNAQWWLLFAILVANKGAEITEKKLVALLEMVKYGSPFHRIRGIAIIPGGLDYALRKVKTGQYKRVEKALCYVADPRHKSGFPEDPRTVTLEQLLAVPGIGPKTAKWYYQLLHPAAYVAALDTHVLKFLRDQGIPNVPKNTPPEGPTYKRLEAEFILLCTRTGLTPRDLDFFVWSVYREGGKVLLPQRARTEAPPHHD